MVRCDGNLRKNPGALGLGGTTGRNCGHRTAAPVAAVRHTRNPAPRGHTLHPSTRYGCTNLTVGVKSGLSAPALCACAREPWHDMIRLRCISCFPRPRASACAQATPSHAATPALLILLYPSPCGCSKPHHLAHHTDLKSMSPWRWLPRPQPPPTHMPLTPMRVRDASSRMARRRTNHTALSRGSCERCAASAVTQRR